MREWILERKRQRTVETSNQSPHIKSYQEESAIAKPSMSSADWQPVSVAHATSTKKVKDSHNYLEGLQHKTF